MGHLVTFEGIDGTGKSTLVQGLTQRLVAEGYAVRAEREETESAYGELVRQSIRDGADPLVTTLLFVADRLQHAKTMQAVLDSGHHILCDRYHDSTLAYQSVTLRGRVQDPGAYLEALQAGLPLRPVHTFLLTCPPERAVERTRARGPAHSYEKAAFLAEVQEAYLSLARKEPQRFTVFDASGSPESVLASVLPKLRKLLR